VGCPLRRKRSRHARPAAIAAITILGGYSHAASHEAASHAAAPRKAPAALSVGCSASVATGKLLAGQRPVTMPVPGSPTAMAGTPDGRWAFASVPAGSSGEIAVIALLGNYDSGTVEEFPVPKAS
jgi:hypothetical protein